MSKIAPWQVREGNRSRSTKKERVNFAVNESGFKGGQVEKTSLGKAGASISG